MVRGERQRDKAEGIPPHRLFNLTGGLPTNLIDVGMLGSFAGGDSLDSLIYVIAGKNLPDRQIDQTADKALANILRRLHEEYMAIKPSGITPQ